MGTSANGDVFIPSLDERPKQKGPPRVLFQFSSSLRQEKPILQLLQPDPIQHLRQPFRRLPARQILVLRDDQLILHRMLDVYKRQGDGRLEQFRTTAFTLVDAQLHYDLGRQVPSLKGARVQLNVTNLTDKRHVASCCLLYTSRCV